MMPSSKKPKKLTQTEVKITFNYTEEQGLNVTIKTPRLLIRSVIEDDVDNYFELFNNSKVMEKYATGQPITDKSRIDTRIKGWANRWQSKEPDPFNGLAVFKTDTSEFIGHVVIGRSVQGKGVSELAYIFHKNFWGQGYGSEAVSAIVNHYAPQIIERHYKLDGFELSEVVATTRIEHTRSNNILQLVGLTTNTDEVNEKFGAQRYIYSIKSQSLLEIHNSLADKEPNQSQNMAQLGAFPVGTNNAAIQVESTNSVDKIPSV